MTQKIRSLFDYLYANPRKLFLLDFGGALLTAFFTGLVLFNFEDVFGMQQEILRYLSGVACAYAVYSFCCYGFAPSNWSFFMKVLVIFNLLYLCFTFEMVNLFYNKLTIFGLGYFILEMLAMGVLITTELSLLFRASRDHSL